MTALVLLSLPLSLLVVTGLALLAFQDAVFRSRQCVETPLSLGSGPDRRPGPTRELTAVIHRLDQRMDATAVCPDTPFIPVVTDAEAEAIAQEVWQRGPLEVERVFDRAQVAHGRCPLRMKDGLCACAAARPLACIGRCVAGGDSPEWVDGLGQTFSSAFQQHLADHHLDAHVRGVDEAMVSLLKPAATR